MNEKITLKIIGMHCASCEKIIKLALEDEKGINSAEVDYDTATAVLDFDPDIIEKNKIREVIEGLGYKIDLAK